jgi:hypothetical protein
MKLKMKRKELLEMCKYLGVQYKEVLLDFTYENYKLGGQLNRWLTEKNIDAIIVINEYIRRHEKNDEQTYKFIKNVLTIQCTINNFEKYKIKLIVDHGEYIQIKFRERVLAPQLNILKNRFGYKLKEVNIFLNGTYYFTLGEASSCYIKIVNDYVNGKLMLNGSPITPFYIQRILTEGDGPCDKLNKNHDIEIERIDDNTINQYPLDCRSKGRIDVMFKTISKKDEPKMSATEKNVCVCVNGKTVDISAELAVQIIKEHEDKDKDYCGYGDFVRDFLDCLRSKEKSYATWLESNKSTNIIVDVKNRNMYIRMPNANSEMYIDIVNAIHETTRKQNPGYWLSGQVENQKYGYFSINIGSPQ